MSLRLCGLLISALSLFSLRPASIAAQPTASLGRISFPNSGSASAQPPFVRGVLLLHSFEYDDAIAAFRDAQRIDPGFALAYWGEAMCYHQPLWLNENVAKAREALARLAPTRDGRQAKAKTARERAYLDAVERLFGDGDTASRDRAFADRMGEVAREFPHDDEAAAFYALGLLSTAGIGTGRRDVDVMLKAGGIASAILDRNPDHPGAAHYALHAYDDGEHAALGLKAARIYARIAPASSHAQHMPSHVFLPLGMWDEASASDEKSFAVSVDRVKRLGLSMAQADFHSLSWLHYEYVQQGRFAKAREVEETVARAIASQNGPGPTARPRPPAHVESEIGRGYAPMSLQSELASMRARRIVDAAAWSDMKGQGSFGNIDELFALGEASVSLGDMDRAQVALEHLDTASNTVPDVDAREVARIMTAELDALMKAARGDLRAALAAAKYAATSEAKRPKPIARPYPVKPAGELYAEILLRGGDATAAIAEFQRALARTPRRPAALLGLARAAQKAGRHAEAARAGKEFLSVWHAADAGRPEIAEMRALAK